MKPKIFIKWYLIISVVLLFLALLWFFTKIVLMTIVGTFLLFMLLGFIFSE
jgi:hypothetical protein